MRDYRDPDYYTEEDEEEKRDKYYLWLDDEMKEKRIEEEFEND